MKTLLVFIIVIFSFPASAQQQPCTDRLSVIEHLSSRYSESTIGLGLSNSGGVVELLSSKIKRGWTIIITLPDGRSCLVAAGTNWETIKPIKIGQPL